MTGHMLSFWNIITYYFPFEFAFHRLISQFSAMDVSSDLTEFGRTPVAVISAGAKSILDIPRTLEYLVLELLSTNIGSCLSNCIIFQVRFIFL